MKKIITLLLLSVFILYSCGESLPGLDDIELSNIDLPTTLDEIEIPTDYVYVLNLSSKKYHLQYCKYAISINVKNRYETGDMNYIMSMEFTPCSICEPDRR